MKARVLTSLCLAGILSVGSTSSYGDSATTDPVGVIRVSAPANSDTYISIPFKRTPEFAGMTSGSPTANTTYDLGEAFVDSNANGVRDTGESFTDSINVLSIAGSPNFAASQFVYNSSSQPKRYYVLLLDGTKAGMYYSVVGNGTASVTLDLKGDTLGTAVPSGSRLQIVPYDTLGSLFPSGQGIVGSPSHSARSVQTQILIPDHSTAGTDLASSLSYYYYSGIDAPGWRKIGVPEVIVNDAVLYPDSPFTVRNAGTASTLTFTGTVAMSTLQTPLNVATVAQDNAVALPVPTPLTLAQTNLYPNSFVGSSSRSGRLVQDQLLVWDNNTTGQDRAASRSYYYYTGTEAPGAGWYLVGDDTTIRNNSVADSVLGSGNTVVIRKAKTNTNATVFWSVKPPYVP